MTVLITPEQGAKLQGATRSAALAIAGFNAHMRRQARIICKAFDVPLWMVAGRRYRHQCEQCLRRFPGPWQLRKHERTAHG